MKRRDKFGFVTALVIISVPMPFGSPIVIAIGLDRMRFPFASSKGQRF